MKRSTTMLLLLFYEGREQVPLDWVARDFFADMSRRQLLRNCTKGNIPLPVSWVEEDGENPIPTVQMIDLAAFLRQRQAAAAKHLESVLTRSNSELRRG